MGTECTQITLEFQPAGKREVVGQFDGGTITSDGGAVLLGEVEKKRSIIKQFAACFVDHRTESMIEHTVQELVAQRVYGLALGYEDLNDHDQLRTDPLLAALAGKEDVTGEHRRRVSDRGNALAGKSTLNRLELYSGDPAKDGEYKKIAVDEAAVERYFAEIFLQAHPAGRDRRKLFWTSMPRTIRCTGSRKGGFFTATMETTAICRSIFSAETFCCARSCGRPIRIRARVLLKSWSESSIRFDNDGLRCESSSVPTRGLRGKKS